MSVKSSLGRQLGTQFDTVFDVVKSNPIYEKSGGKIPTLDLDFAKSKSFFDRRSNKNKITFARASSGTYVGSDGLIKTSPVNLLTYSEEFDNTSWAKSNSTVNANTASAPSGETTADALIENTATSTHSISKSVSASSSTTYTFTVHAKANGRSHIDLNISGVVTTTCIVRFTLSGSGTSAIRQGSPTPTHSITALSGGWYRCQLTFTTTSAGSALSQIQIAPDGSSSAFYTGDGVSGVYIWGAQLEEGTTATDYIPTTSTKSGTPRFDHDPATGESLGLLIEEERTNYASQSIVAINSTLVSASDTTYAPVNFESRVHKFTIGSSGLQFYIPLFNAPGYSTLNLFDTLSFYLKSDNPVTISSPYDGSALSSGLYFANGTTMPFSTEITTEPGPLGFTRYSIKYTNPTATNGNSVARAQIVVDGTGDFYVFGAQWESRKDFPTSYIPTSGTTVTRAADVAEITGANFEKTNLLQYSERFDDASWNRSGGVVVIPNSMVAPDGTATADTVEFSQQYANIRKFNVVTTPGAKATLSFYAKNIDGNANLYLRGSETGTIYLDLITVTSEWARYSATFTHDGTNDIGFFLQDRNASGFGSVAVWGAQVEEGSVLTDYTPSVESFVSRASTATYADDTTGLIKTTPVNLLTYSEEFDNASWIKTNTSVTADSVAAPDGTLTADKLEQTTTGGNRFVYRDSLNSNTSAGQYVASIFVKPVSPVEQFSIRVDSSNESAKRFTYDFAAETKTEETDCTGTVTNVGDGWYRMSAAFTVGFNIVNVVYDLGVHGGGSIGDFVYLWGAQLEEGTTATPYIKTTSTISGAARYENNELILEEARTNVILYSEDFTNAYWTTQNGSTDLNTNGVLNPKGDQAYLYTANSGNARKRLFSGNTTPGAVSFTFSLYVKDAGARYVQMLWGGDSNDGYCNFDLVNGTPGSNGSNVSNPKITSIGNGWYRLSMYVQNTVETQVFGIHAVDSANAAFSSLANYEGEAFYLFGAQVETGSYPTSYIPTEGTTVTRAADVSTSALGVDSFYNQTEGTWYGEVKKAYPTTQRLFEVGNSSTGEYSVSIRPGPTSTFFARQASSSSSVNHSYPAKIAVADSATNIQGCVNGTLATIISNGTSPTDDKLSIGGVMSTTTSDNTISRLAYFNTRLSDDKLKSITS